jgi:hypothetical protein
MYTQWVDRPQNGVIEDYNSWKLQRTICAKGQEDDICKIWWSPTYLCFASKQRFISEPTEPNMTLTNGREICCYNFICVNQTIGSM